MSLTLGATSALLETVDRFSATADRISNSISPTESPPAEAVPPTEETADSREATDEADADPASDSAALARDTADLIRAEAEIQANVILIQQNDVTVGSLIDLVA